MAGPLTVDIVAPDRKLWSGTATRVVAPAIEGEIGLLANHEPILALLRPGTVRVHGDESVEFAVVRGFVSFDHNTITIVAVQPEDTDDDESTQAEQSAEV